MLHRALVSLSLFVSLSVDVGAYRAEYSGFAAHYRPGLMEEVARRRRLPQVPCMVATSYYTIGTWIYVQSRKNGRGLRCRVTDVPHPADKASLQKRRIVVEFDFKSATIMCNIQRYNQEPPQACPVVLSRTSAGK